MLSARFLFTFSLALVAGLTLGDRAPGWRTERYPTGDVYRISHFVDDKLDGFQYEYGIGAHLRARSHYRQGIKEGRQAGWYLDGSRRFEANFRAGILEGVQTEWHQNGAVFREQVFVHGEEVSRKVLYAGSEIFSNYTRRDGRKYGVDGGSLCMETKREGEK